MRDDQLANYRFTKNSRLLSGADYSYLNCSEAKRVSTRYARGYYRLSGVKSLNARIGMKITKKAGNAVARNRYKRIIRECFRQNAIRNCPIDVVVILHANKIKQANDGQEVEQEIKRDLYYLFNKIKNSVSTE